MKSTLQDIFEFQTLIVLLAPTIAICKKMVGLILFKQFAL